MCIRDSNKTVTGPAGARERDTDGVAAGGDNFGAKVTHRDLELALLRGRRSVCRPGSPQRTSAVERGTRASAWRQRAQCGPPYVKFFTTVSYAKQSFVSGGPIGRD